MQEQLTFLRVLQQLDDQLRRLRGEEERLPWQLQAPEQALQQAQEQFAAIHAGIDQSERHQRACERELELSQAALTKMEGKLREVKTNKEYTAVLAEIAMGQERLSTLEDQILQVMEVIEQQRHEQRTQEQAIQQATQALQACRQTLQQARAALHRDIEALEQRRQQTAVLLPAEILGVYTKVATQHGGHAIAQLSDGACGGCHLTVQPQLVSEIRQQTALHTCPHCRLLLLWPA